MTITEPTAPTIPEPPSWFDVDSIVTDGQRTAAVDMAKRLANPSDVQDLAGLLVEAGALYRDIDLATARAAAQITEDLGDLDPDGRWSVEFIDGLHLALSVMTGARALFDALSEVAALADPDAIGLENQHIVDTETVATSTAQAPKWLNPAVFPHELISRLDEMADKVIAEAKPFLPTVLKAQELYGLYLTASDGLPEELIDLLLKSRLEEVLSGLSALCAPDPHSCIGLSDAESCRGLKALGVAATDLPHRQRDLIDEEVLAS
jgi:hypothetical protein